MAEAGRDVAGRLYWCGEHTSVERFGYADGAFAKWAEGGGEAGGEVEG